MIKIDCKTGLEKGLIDKDVFDREIALCKEMYDNDGGCCWGRCKDCGVVPLLNKLYKGELVDDGAELKNLKKRLINLEE